MAADAEDDGPVVNAQAPGEPPPGPGAAGSSWPRGIWLIATGATFRTSFPVALVVGSLLSAVNQGGEFLAGDIDGITLVRIVANYAIPYVVSSIGFLSAHRSRLPPR